MDFPKIGTGEGSMLGGLKSKLGLGGKKDDARADYDGYDDGQGYDDGYGNYDEYAEYAEYADDRGAYNEPESSFGRRSLNSASNRSYDNSLVEGAYGTRTGVTKPRLVSMDDVRAHTQYNPDASLGYNGASDDGAGYRSYSHDAASTRGGVSADMPEWRRSEGLDSLFTSTTSGASRESAGLGMNDARSSFSASPLAQGAAEKQGGAGGSTSNGVYDPFESYTATKRPLPGAAPSRTLSVIAPTAYSDVERMAEIVRGGDAVVLVLQNTQDALSKRLMDFSCGVASALDARIDCIGNKVFAINCGPALTESELQKLHSQGVL